MDNPLLTGDVLVGGRRIAFGIHGSGDPVILVHGTPSHSYIWRNVAPGLIEAGFQVFLFDLLGFGASERPTDADTSVAAQTDLVVGLMAEWGLASSRVAAHDIGGAVGMRLGVFHPLLVEQLTVVDPVSYDSWPSPTWRKIIDEHLESYAAMTAEEFESMMTRQLQMTVSEKERMSGETLTAYLAPISGALGQASFFRHQVAHYDSRYTMEIADRLPEVSLPVQIIWGEDDEWQPVAFGHRLHDDIPGSQLVVVPGAGHFLMEDRPDEVTRHLIDFFRG